MTWLKFRTKWREGTYDNWEYTEVNDSMLPDEYEEYINDCELGYSELTNEGFRGVEVVVVDSPSDEWLFDKRESLLKKIAQCQALADRYEQMLWDSKLNLEN